MILKKLHVFVRGQAGQTVPLYGIADTESLTPRLARWALRIAAGEDACGEVWDDAGIGYRVYAHSARKVTLKW